MLELGPLRRIRHNLLGPDKETVVSVITYEFREQDDGTILTGIEVMTRPMEQTAFEDAGTGWEFALKAVKDLAENNNRQRS
ncbi:SRPBCC family protein [Niabella aurantiaca]|uniref:SRPBCC family protein n=1 Tax=Niabella aurantiaca TaxID=379900 RepID=UPI00036B6AE3|nr:hypothetical protein [Niabella aurantiaca]